MAVDGEVEVGEELGYSLVGKVFFEAEFGVGMDLVGVLDRT